MANVRGLVLAETLAADHLVHEAKVQMVIDLQFIMPRGLILYY